MLPDVAHFRVTQTALEDPNSVTGSNELRKPKRGLSSWDPFLIPCVAKQQENLSRPEETLGVKQSPPASCAGDSLARLAWQGALGHGRKHLCEEITAS